MAEVEEGAPLASLPESAAVKVQEKDQEVEVADGGETVEAPQDVSDHKRKHDELDAVGEEADEKKTAEEDEVVVLEVPNGEERSADIEKTEEVVQRDEEGTGAARDVKRQRFEAEADESDDQQAAATLVGNGADFAAENIESPPPVEREKMVALTSEQDDTYSSGQQESSAALLTSSRKIEIPNSKVGVLIGKAGETIRYLQYNSGAKIQITRDVDADPYSSSRPVELIGSIDCISKAEQLIKDVIAEAEAGGSPALVARGFGTAQSGSEQLEIQVPNEKVGVIIGKGGETIKNLQTRSGARIQLIPQHLPEGDQSKVRTVRISGNKKHIETATEMIQEVMNQMWLHWFLGVAILHHSSFIYKEDIRIQEITLAFEEFLVDSCGVRCCLVSYLQENKTPGRPSPLSGGYSQQVYRPRGPTPPQWGPRSMHPAAGYDYHQRGMYPSQTPQYPPSYGGYQQQPPPRDSYGGGWGQRPPVHAPSQPGGYGYYGHGGPPMDSQASGHLSAPAASNPTHAPGNYYGPSQGPGYGQPVPYSQSVPTQQNQGQGYNELNTQLPNQQMYGQQSLSSQSGPYSQAPQSVYQQPYNAAAYGGAPSQGPPQSYGQPRPSQPGDQMYQGSNPNYGSGGSSQQPYPYGSGVSQPMPAYSQPYGGSADSYAQQPSSGYAQQGGPAATGYGQPGPAAPTYPHASQSSGGYSQYPQPQPTYTEQPAPSNNAPPAYGYQAGPTDSAYGAPPASGQTGYTQPPANPSGQSVQPQSGYGSYPGSAPVGYS